MYRCICVYRCKCCMCTYIWPCICTSWYIYIVYVYVCVYVYVYVYVYVCIDVCVHVWIGDFLRYMLLDGIGTSCSRVSRWRPVHGFGIAFCFDRTIAVRWLEPKGFCGWPFGWSGTWLFTWGYCRTLWYSPHSHPPRMTDFVSYAQESQFKSPILQFTFVELERVECSSRTSYLRCGLLRSLQTKQKVCSHARWQDVVYVQHWGSSDVA